MNVIKILYLDDSEADINLLKDTIDNQEDTFFVHPEVQSVSRIEDLSEQNFADYPIIITDLNVPPHNPKDICDFWRKRKPENSILIAFTGALPDHECEVFDYSIDKNQGVKFLVKVLNLQSRFI